MDGQGHSEELISQADFCTADPIGRDTIVAPGTARGNGAIAIIRVSGPDTRPILHRLFRPRGGRDPWDVPRMLILGDVLDHDGQAIDRGMAVWMPQEASPTGEDYAELHIHGGMGLVGLVMESALAVGGRSALPGEFLKRGFLQGRINLTEAEAVAAALAARTSAAARAAARNLAGHLGQAASRIRDQLLTALAILEAATDFPDEDLPLPDESILQGALESARLELEDLLKGSRRALRVHAGARVVLLGEPNVGKSSLFNWLVGHERAIVSPEPGTTRDTIEAVLDLEGIPVTLIDTAGLREGADAIERAGMARTRQEAATADLILELVGSPAWHPEWLPESQQYQGGRILVRTKADETPVEARKSGQHEIWVSSRTGEGMDQLLGAMVARLTGDSLSVTGEESLLTNERQFEAVKASQEGLMLVLAALDRQLGYELVSVHIREALEPLDGLLGRQTSEDVLSLLFSRFCIGK